MADESPKKEKAPFLVRVADRLVKDQQELDELAVQLALGKAEARDKFEEVKKQLRKRVRKVSRKLSSEIEEGKEWAQSLDDKLANLGKQLIKEKPETPQAFQEQKQDILTELDAVEKEIHKSAGTSRFSRSFALASEKIRLQMDLLERKMSAGKKELSEEFKEQMASARTRIDSIASKLKENKDEVDEKLDDFRDDVREAYEDLKKAVRSW